MMNEVAAALYGGWRHVVIYQYNSDEAIQWCEDKFGIYVSSDWIEIKIVDGILVFPCGAAPVLANIAGRWDIFGVCDAADRSCFVFTNAKDAVEFKLRFG